MNWKDFKKLSTEEKKAIWPTLNAEIRKRIQKQRKTALTNNLEETK